MGGILKSVGRLFGIDSSAQKRAAEMQAAAIRAAAEETRRQSQQAAQQAARQAAEQVRLAQERAQVAAKIQEQAKARPEEVQVDIGPPDMSDTPQRRRRPYQAPSSPGGSLRI